MIKIQKQATPKILLDHKEEWTDALLKAVERYNGYVHIPADEKKKLTAHYRHEEIKRVLFSSSYQKCAFCECKPAECGNPEVEHFEPKSIYPELTFEWENLLPSCRKCNDAKSDFNTRKTPIINPSKENPEALLAYDFLRVVPVQGSGQETKAKNTIEVCNLNCKRLYDARSELLKEISEYIDYLNKHFESIAEADTDAKRHRRITQLSNSIATIDSLLGADGLYSAFAKSVILQNADYKKAKEIISNEYNLQSV